MNKKFRLQRLFGTSGKCLDIALDHGFFNEVSFLNGIEDLAPAIQALVAAQPDAIQLTVGQAEILQRIPGKNRPALVLRTDVANCYNPQIHEVLFSLLIDDAVEQALVLDAACVVVNLLLLPNQPDLHRQCVANVARLKPLCERYGMPLMIEPLVMRPNEENGGYQVDGDLNKILPLVRQACELGADLIKADPCDDLSQYHRVITVAGRPVLPRGGGKADERQVLQRTWALMQQGASGIVYGRNIIQHEKPVAMTRALMAIVHEGASVSQALALLAG
ncbi:MAG: aldolase [candidate division KSB1 bacterium]|nr:aldolase [candidate division KSB1 bacterium]MDZ7276225.1 aldolase [candidate division KSB1 bacterium]MDZ7287969.1 aldolase [candidate division KSB1 bacterium]MDZ7300018.1 aldolase [candidate division KSB1 bacterium]MDZ7308561.1 aldolase [candidate division KSB1 bacterium]